MTWPFSWLSGKDEVVRAGDAEHELAARLARAGSSVVAAAHPGYAAPAPHLKSDAFISTPNGLRGAPRAVIPRPLDPQRRDLRKSVDAFENLWTLSGQLTDTPYNFS
jgi:hypothetical protein